MELDDYLAGMRAATTADELEAALMAPYEHPYAGPIWNAICKTRVEEGLRLCADHPQGRLVPRFNGDAITVCGELLTPGPGFLAQNQHFDSPEVTQLVKGALVRQGLSSRAAHRVAQAWIEYPHRCLAILESALKGELDDPPMNKLFLSHLGRGPVALTVADNNADHEHRRASMPCQCHGTLFEWSNQEDDGITVVNWRCNRCDRVFAEYVTPERLDAIEKSKYDSIPHI
jgi:hypothetical protein